MTENETGRGRNRDENETGLELIESSVPSLLMESNGKAIAALKDMTAGIDITGNVHKFSVGESIRGYVAGVKPMVDKADPTRLINAIRFVIADPKEGKAVTKILSDIVIRTTLADDAVSVENAIRNGNVPHFPAYEINCTEVNVKGKHGDFKKFEIRRLF